MIHQGECMRSNLPVTEQEYRLDDGVSMVTKTDLKGKITYANPAFIEASGFSEQELLGDAHNVVRHPDMPAEVFSDLWVTLSERLPWTGMVKNRRKNGDYFWVLMNVTPLQKKPPTSGFLAVSNTPSAQQVAEAERVYRLFREGRQGNMRIRHGRIERGGLAGIMDSIRRIPVRLRIQLTTAAAAVLMWTLGALGWWETSAGAHAVGVDSWLPLSLAAAGALGGVLLLLFGYFISRTILLPIDHALEVAHAISWGDLSLRFEMDAADETAELMLALNQMKSNLVAVVSDTDALVANISSLSAAVGGNAQEQAARVEALQQQAAKLSQVIDVFRVRG